MVMSLTFWKLSGAGNDFVALDNMHGVAPPEGKIRAEWVRAICARRLGVGADGVLLVEPSESADFRMRYYNSDGGEAETCGNGARCIARFAHLLGLVGPCMRFETLAGPYEARVEADSVRVSMGDAHSLELDIEIDVPGLYRGRVDFVNSGVPHAVLWVDDIEDAPVADLGRAIRRHPRFAPAGTNVNFVASAGPDRFVIRTYERGVEDETLACGTGSIAAAVVAAHRGLANSPVRLTTRSGADLSVRMTLSESGAFDVSLEGEARVVYNGELREVAPNWSGAGSEPADRGREARAALGV
ncbi:diaminopimelate epimerase [Candidatus Sumerlaeota bacterium]|nr:diaminopimelate epimerase [Candidatus Sumerlaeota bacterium]